MDQSLSDGRRPDYAPASAVDEELAAEATSVSGAGTGMGGERLFLLLAIVVGICSGLAVVAFRLAIERCRTLLLGPTLIPPHTRALLAPALMGIVVAVLVMWVFPAVRGSGVNQTKAALYIYNGYIPLRTAIGKFITSALAIGSGHSLGPEDPSLQIGATLASALGRRVRLSREKLRLLAPMGAAAGLAAAFNAPISAVLFVIEEVIGRWSAGILGAVVLSTISSVVVARGFLGSEPLFRIPPVAVIRPAELLAYAILGVVGGAASVAFARGIAVLRPLAKRAPHWTQYLQPALAGLVIGGIAWAGFPQVMGAGYDFIEQALHDRYTWQLLGILAGLKILATTCSFVSGTPGGMFAPTLFIGAMLGGAVGDVERTMFPHLTGTVATYGLVGMGVLFAGFLRAPMTSVFMVLEVSADYSIIVPVILANTVAYVISRTLAPVPVFDMLSKQDGLSLPSMEELREIPVVRVEDAMQTKNIIILGPDETLAAAQHLLHAAPNAVAFLHREGGWVPVTKKQVDDLIAAGLSAWRIGEAITSPATPFVYPDHPLHTALPSLYEHTMVPVIHRAHPGQVEGFLSLSCALRAYRRVARSRRVQDGP